MRPFFVFSIMRQTKIQKRSRQKKQNDRPAKKTQTKYKKDKKTKHTKITKNTKNETYNRPKIQKITPHEKTPNNYAPRKIQKMQNLPQWVAKPKFVKFADALTRVLADFAARLHWFYFATIQKDSNFAKILVESARKNNVTQNSWVLLALWPSSEYVVWGTMAS